MAKSEHNVDGYENLSVHERDDGFRKQDSVPSVKVLGRVGHSNKGHSACFTLAARVSFICRASITRQDMEAQHLFAVPLINFLMYVFMAGKNGTP